jgi:DNA-binding NtrC family response regulator
MPKERIILIAERNPYIRNLVKRELLSEGYHAFTVENTSQLKNWMHLRRAPDILILDPDLPGDEKQNISAILASYPEMPVIFHSLSNEKWSETPSLKHSILVEKNGNSINSVKQWIDFFISQTALDEVTER